MWRRQELIDTGQLPGTTSADNAVLIAARRRIAALEPEVAIHRRAAELRKGHQRRKRQYEAIAVRPRRACLSSSRPGGSQHLAAGGRPAVGHDINYAVVLDVPSRRTCIELANAFSSTWRSSTTVVAVTPDSACSRRPSTNSSPRSTQSPEIQQPDSANRR